MPRKKTKKEPELSRRERIKEKAKGFNKEVRKALSTALIAAFGFIIALVWRDVITGYVNSISETSPVQGQLFSAITVTLISVIGIIVITKYITINED